VFLMPFPSCPRAGIAGVDIASLWTVFQVAGREIVVHKDLDLRSNAANWSRWWGVGQRQDR
jgi:hypothetical protein